jgi:hypothetical protein
MRFVIEDDWIGDMEFSGKSMIVFNVMFTLR